MLGRDTLDGERHDFLRLTIGVPAGRLADFAQAVRGVSMRLLLETADELELGFCCRETCEALETRPLTREQLLELGLTVGNLLLAPPHFAGAFAQLAIPQLHRLATSLQTGLAFDELPLLRRQLIATAAGFDLPRLALLQHLFLSRQDGALAQRLRLALPLPDQPTTFVLGGTACSLLTGQLGADALTSAQHERQTGRDERERAQCGREKCLRHDLYLQRGRAAVFGSPGDAAQQDRLR